MPALFSRRTKPKPPQQITIAKAGYFGAVSSADIDRLGLSSPTPSTADAQLLPSVPTKDDLPPPLPKDRPNGNVTQDSSVSRQSSRASASTNPPAAAAATNEFGQIQSHAPKAATVAASSQALLERSYLTSASTSTIGGGRRLAPPPAALHSVSSRQSLRRSLSPSSYAHDDSSGIISPGAAGAAAAASKTYAYGYTPDGWQVYLDASRVLVLLEACAVQIRSRGLDNPLIFSSMALDLSPTNVASLIRAFTSSPSGQRTIPASFFDEVRYANPHDLAALVKWGFARMGRVLAVPVPVPGAKRGEVREEMVYVQQRGFLDLEVYNAWREQERRQSYPPTAFKDLLSHLGPENVKLLCSLFSLLSSTVAYSLKNGMMPAKLAKHFGALLFGLPEDETFARTYDAYVRASNATEHLLLAYIRYLATTATLPPRLAQHVSGYPSMLVSEISMVEGTSSRMVPVTQIERNVRLYSPDLVQTACELDLAESCREWTDCRNDNEALGRDPQLSDKFRKLVNLRGGALQGRRAGAAKKGDASVEEDDAVVGHGSLVNKQWDEFISGGFAAPDSSKLAFDLNESARRNRGVKRETVQWNEFSKDGFQGEEGATLADVLSFDDVLKQDVNNWPSERDHLHAKLKSRQDKLPPFDYDTTPKLVASPTLSGTPRGAVDSHPISRMDETFADVWADYLLGNGWSNRDELTHRTANFVVVQYKSRPNASTVGSQSTALAAPTRFRKDEMLQDERMDAAWFVVQEVVPAQYRADLEAAGRGKGKGLAMIRKFATFRSRKEKSNGASDTVAEDDVFKAGSGGTTKRILLSDQLKRNGSKNASQSTLRSNRTSVERERGEEQEEFGHAVFRSEGHQQGGSRLMSTLRAKSLRVVKSARRGASSPALKAAAVADEIEPQLSNGNGTTGVQQQGDVDVDRSFTSADFETRSVATDASPIGDDASFTSAKRKPTQIASRGGSKKPASRNDDAWIDIMLKANGRMAGQDAAPVVGARKTSLGLAVDETAQLSVAGPSGSTTPRGGSFEVHSGPRSSTPPPAVSAKHTPELQQQQQDDLGLSRIESRSPEPQVSPDVSGSTMRDVHSSSASPTVKPAPPIDAVAAARAALKSRKEAAARPAAQIDAKKLVESLRAGLSPIEAVRASKGASSVEERTGGVEMGKKGHRDVFAKDPVAGRVADVASKFGGRAAATASGRPVKMVDKAPPASPEVRVERTSLDDEIYPEDAASNIDPRETRDSPLSRSLALEQVEQLAPCEGGYSWESRRGEREAEGGPTRFEPYQPGMPLDNVLEESESVVSTNA